MDCRAYPPSQVPPTSKLVRDYIEDFSKLSSFYAHPPNLQSVASYARNLKFPDERRRTVAQILREQNVSFGGSAETEKNLRRLEEGAVAVVSGQQAGLLGGPSYAFYKALTAIQTAKELSNDGIAAVPVFWMATEDHDLDEVRHATWFSDGNLQRLELSKLEEQPVPVGKIKLGREIDEVLREAGATLAGPFGAETAEILRQSYKPDETYGTAFAKMFAKVFAEQGLILLDPLDPKLHVVAAPIMCQALAQRDALEAALLQRGKDLQRAGYETQVKVTARSTLLFTLRDGQRHVVNATNGEFASVGEMGPRAQWLKRVDTEPEHFSPNALLRPVVQDYLLPTAAYFGGPAEIAYFAQSSVVYEKLLGTMPVILPRADFTLVDPKAVRLMKKYKVGIEDAWKGLQHLLRHMYADAIPKTLTREFDGTIRNLDKQLQKLQHSIAKVDPTVQGSIARSGKRIQYQVEKMRRQTGVSLDRHEKLIQQHAHFLENLLFPHKALQSRELCFLPFLARLGPAGLQDLQALTSAKNPGQLCVVEIP
jgi:bacillithiol biosynthesis cysteine-adding enzyme BshC